MPLERKSNLYRARSLPSMAALREIVGELQPGHPDTAEKTDLSSDSGRFETLLGEMTSVFVRITADQIDDQIHVWLDRIARSFEIDRATLAEYDASIGGLRTTHCWAREGITPMPLGMNTSEFVPWLTRKLLAGETVVFEKPEDLPRDALLDIAFVSRRGIRSHVSFPLTAAGTVVGAIAFGSITTERNWSPGSVNRLRLIGNLFGSALERKHNLEEIRRLHSGLNHAADTAMMGELTAALAHELNQPLSAILSNAQAASRMLDGEKPDLPEVVAALEDIVRDDARAVDIIRYVRALFQRDAVQKSRVNPEDIMHDVEKILKPDAVLKGISLRLHIARTVRDICVNKTQLTQALINLVRNAFDAVLDNGNNPREVIVSTAMTSDGRVLMQVRDSGKGIDPDTLAHMFDAFFTTKPKGMGMGLAIARTVIENHSGQLRAFPNRDRGTTFEITLPIADAE